TASVPLTVKFALVLLVSEAGSLVIEVSGAVVSNVKVSEAVPVLPAPLVSLAMMVCWPSARPVSVNVHAPLLSAVAVVLIAVPSTVKLITAFGSAPPVRVGSDVSLSVGNEPVSFLRASVTVGAEPGAVYVPLVSLMVSTGP